MKKLFSIFAATALMLSFVACDKKDKSKDEPTPEPEQPQEEVVEITKSKGVIYNDQTAVYGWWQVMAYEEEYFLSLSNGNKVDKASGVYSVKNLDPEYSYYKAYNAAGGVDSISFTSGTITVEELASGAVTFKGTLKGNDNKSYKIDLTYTDPVAEKTENYTISNGEIDDYTTSQYEYFDIGGITDDYSMLVNLDINSNVIAGTYTIEDIDTYYSYLETMDGYLDIFDANATIIDNGDGSYNCAASVLCYNCILYKFDITVPAEAADGAPAKAPAKKQAKRNVAFKGARVR